MTGSVAETGSVAGSGSVAPSASVAMRGRARAPLRRSLIVALMLLPVTAVAAHPFEFVTPVGFVSLKDGTSVPWVGEREAEVRAEASAADAFAIRQQDGVIVATFSAVVQRGGAPVASWQEYLERSAKAASSLGGAVVHPARRMDLGGVECAVADVEHSFGGRPLRERYYAIPGGDQWAAVKLLAEADRFESVAATADDAVRRIRGASPSTETDPISHEQARGRLLILGGALLVGSLVFQSIRRRRKKAAGRART